MARGLEPGAITDREEDLGCGLDADPRRAHQDRGEREGIQHGLDFVGDRGPLRFQLLDLPGHLGITSSTVAVVGTVTLRSPSAVKIFSTSAEGSRREWERANLRTRPRPADVNPVGPPNFSSSSSTRSVEGVPPGKTRSRACLLRSWRLEV